MAGIDIVTQVLNTIVFFLKWFWWLILLGVLFGMKFKMKYWPVEAVIIEKRGANLIKTNDRAGKFTDPFTGIVGYKLQKAGDTIPVVNYDWVMHNVVVNNSFFEKITSFLRGNIGTLFFFRYGSKQYKPIKIVMGDKTVTKFQEVKNEKGETIYVQVYKQFDPRNKLGMLDFEVVDWDNMNFMVQEQRASIERRKKSAEWIKTIAVPLAIIGATVIFSIIMIKFGFDFATQLKAGSAPTPETAPATKPNIPVINNLLP
jgi:hypothetical protein